MQPKTEFTKGQSVILDKGFKNSSIVKVVNQSPFRLITLIESDGKQWDVLTLRLTEIGNESVLPVDKVD